MQNIFKYCYVIVKEIGFCMLYPYTSAESLFRKQSSGILKTHLFLHYFLNITFFLVLWKKLKLENKSENI